MVRRLPIERWRTLPRPLRWLVIAAAAAVALLFAVSVAVSAAANRWIRPLVEEQASAAIPGEVRIGGLGISLLGLSVEIEDLAILREGAGGRPAAGAAGEPILDDAGRPVREAEGQPAVDAQGQPVLEVGRLYASLARLPLLARRVEVKRIEIEQPVVRVVREPSGELDLLRVLVPETPAAEAAAEPAPPAEQIPVRIRRVDLGAGRIEFTDRAQPGAEPLAIEIPRSQIGDVVVIGEPGERRSALHLEVAGEGASIALDGSFRRAGDAIDVDATAEIEKLPLARGRVYLPDLGWSELAGELDAKVHYVHVTGTTQKADGSAELRGLRIGVPTLKEPALAFDSLGVKVDELDLLGRRLALGQVTLSKPRLFFDPANRTSLPLLPNGIPGASPGAAPTGPEARDARESPAAPAAAPGAAPAERATQERVAAPAPPAEAATQAPSAEPAAAPEAPGAAGAAAKPEAAAASEPPKASAPGAFAWSLGGLAIEGAQLVPLGDGAAPLGLDASVGAIASDSASATPVTLKLTQADGSLSIDGSACASQPGFRGKLALDSLALAPLLEVVAPDASAMLLGGTAQGEIEVRVGSLAAGEAPAPGGDVHVSGSLALAGIDARADAGGELAANAGKIELALTGVDLPGALPPPAGAAAPPDAGRLRVAATLRISDTSARSGEGMTAGVKSIDLRLDPLELPGLIAVPGAAATQDAGRLRVSGALTVSGVAVKSGKEGEFGFDLDELELGLAKIEVPGLLAGGEANDAPEPVRIALGRARIAAPKLRLTRTDGGIVLPELAAGAAAPGETAPAAAAARAPQSANAEPPAARSGAKPAAPAKGSPAATKPGGRADASAKTASAGAKPDAREGAASKAEGARGKTDGKAGAPAKAETAGEPDARAAAAPRAEAKAAPKAESTRAKPGAKAAAEAEAAPEARTGAGAAPALRFELGALALEGGSVRFVDRTVKPFYQGDVTGISLTARDLAYPDPSVRDASLKLDAPGPAPLWALGAYTRASSWFEINLDRLPLAPLNPFIRNASGYVVNGGELSLYSKGSVTDGRLYAANWVTLFDPDLSGGGADAPLEKALGVPVSLAISLLKDPAGNIGLSIPIDYDEKGASVRLGSVIGSAVTSVLIGALTSPLKLLGAVVDATGRVKDVTPEPIHFLPGRTELAAGDDERVAALAKLAATRPGLVLRLSGQTSGTDAQFLREATLLEALASGENLPEPARGLAQTLVRRRLRGALEARLEGRPEGLEPEDAQRLDQWLAATSVSSDAMPDLARRRAVRVQELLQTQFGLDPKQIALADPGPPGGSPVPAVDVAI